MIRVIALEREYGVGAGGIAKALADRLGWELWDSAFSAEIARRLKCDVKQVDQRKERCDPIFYSLMKSFMRGSYEGSLQGNPGLELLDAESLADLFEKIVTQVASKGSTVIVGHGAPYFLRDRDDVLSVFVYASFGEKLRRLKGMGKSQHEAESLLESVDRKRAEFVKRYYHRSFPDRSLYHLLINAQVGNDIVEEMILNQVNLLSRQAVTA